MVSLLSLLIFTIPTNLFFVFGEQLGYASGLRVDYLIPKLYASNLVAIAFLAVFFLSKKRQIISSRSAIFLSLIWLMLLIRQCLAATPASSLWFFAELSLAGAVALALSKLPKKVLESPQVYWSLAGTLILQSLLALSQFALQKSLFGYWFLGESDLLHFAGIATQNFAGREFILPSGTTAHPNVLAGFLTIGIVLLWQKKSLIPRWPLLLATVLCVVSIFLTFSLSSWLALMLVLCVVLVRKKLGSIDKKLLLLGLWCLTFFIPFALSQASVLSKNTSLTRRVALNSVAIHQLFEEPIWGGGVNTFARNLAHDNTNRILERFIQPAHNVPLLLLAETGFFGVLLIFGMLLFLRQKNFDLDKLLLVSCLVIPLLSLDHYLYTLETGRMLLAVLILIVVL